MDNFELCYICKYKNEDCNGDHCGHCGRYDYKEFKLDYLVDEIIEALKQVPILERDGTLIVNTDKYEKVTRVLVQHGVYGTLFYQDNE